MLGEPKKVATSQLLPSLLKIGKISFAKNKQNNYQNTRYNNQELWKSFRLGYFDLKVSRA